MHTGKAAGIEREKLPGPEPRAVGQVPLREIRVQAIELGLLERCPVSGEEKDGHAQAGASLPCVVLEHHLARRRTTTGTASRSGRRKIIYYDFIST